MSIDDAYFAIEQRALHYGLIMYALGTQRLPSGGVEQQQAVVDLRKRVIAQLAQATLEELQASLQADPQADRRTRDSARITELATLRDAQNDDVIPTSTRVR